MKRHLFLAGVPATGKSWLGTWLAESHGYIHIDAERNSGADFASAGIHREWDGIISSGRAGGFVAAAERLPNPILVNWGFPTRYLYVVSALQAEGVQAWWFNAPRPLARQAFIARGGIDVCCFDRQMDDIQREWLLISSVFSGKIVEALSPDGAQRTPEELWLEVGAAG